MVLKSGLKLQNLITKLPLLSNAPTQQAKANRVENKQVWRAATSETYTHQSLVAWAWCHGGHS